MGDDRLRNWLVIHPMIKKLYIARSPRIAARMLGEEMLVMSGQGSTLFTLNPTATILWQAADGATPLEEIVQSRICCEFEVRPEEALRDAEALAEDLAKHGILLISEEPISTQSITGKAAGPDASLQATR
jgi:Coenzyme PQQ synthesis protein D (PqqD)